MPKVPQYEQKPIKSIYVPKNASAPASLKQKNLIMTLCERRKMPMPPINTMTMGEASQMISEMLNDSYHKD